MIALKDVVLGMNGRERVVWVKRMQVVMDDFTFSLA
jgi:hypothetical protein